MSDQHGTGIQADLEVKLNYIDKMHSTLIEVSQTRNRALIFLILISITTIAISLGLVSANQGFSFGGFQLSVSIWAVTIVGAWLTLVFYLYFISLAQHRDVILTQIEEEYKSLGLEKENLWREISILDISTMIEDNSLFTKTKLRRLYANIITSIFVYFILLVPLITDVVVSIKLIVVLGWILWGIIPLGLLFCISIISIGVILMAVLA